MTDVQNLFKNIQLQGQTAEALMEKESLHRWSVQLLWLISQVKNYRQV